MSKEIQEGVLSFDDLNNSFDFELPTSVGDNKPEDVVIPELDLTKEDELKIETPEVKPEDEKKVEEPVINLDTSNHFSNLTKKLIDKGEWFDAEIENEDGTKVLLSELKDLDEETFLTLIERQKELKEEDIKEKYVSIDGVDEHKRKLINLIKDGGDLREIFQDPSAVTRPFEGVDLEEETNLASIVYQQYLRQGIDPEGASLLVEKDKKSFSLDTKAAQIVKHYQTAYDQHLEKTAADLQEQKQKEIQEEKEYRSSLSKLYKEQELPDTLSKKLVDIATKRNSEGEYEVDSIYEKLMKDPEQAKDIIFFLTDKEKYLQLNGLDIKRKTNMGTMKTISIIPKDKIKKTTTEIEEPKTGFAFD